MRLKKREQIDSKERGRGRERKYKRVTEGGQRMTRVNKFFSGANRKGKKRREYDRVWHAP